MYVYIYIPISPSLGDAHKVGGSSRPSYSRAGFDSNDSIRLSLSKDRFDSIWMLISINFYVDLLFRIDLLMADQVPGAWYQVPGTWYQVLGTRHMVPFPFRVDFDVDFDRSAHFDSDALDSDFGWHTYRSVPISMRRFR